MHLCFGFGQTPSSHHSPTSVPSQQPPHATSSMEAFWASTQLHCLAWTSHLSHGLFLWEGPSLSSDQNSPRALVSRSPYWFLSWGPTHVIRVQSLLSSVNRHDNHLWVNYIARKSLGTGTLETSDVFGFLLYACCMSLFTRITAQNPMRQEKMAELLHRFLLNFRFSIACFFLSPTLIF